MLNQHEYLIFQKLILSSQNDLARSYVLLTHRVVTYQLHLQRHRKDIMPSQEHQRLAYVKLRNLIKNAINTNW